MEEIIPFGTISDEFKTHLETNPKILFSAPYGLGKTFFLRSFFEDVKQSEYIPIHLFPVNYSISSNEDILSLLKYDILVSLLLNKEVLVELETFKPNLTTVLPTYIEENWKHLTIEVFNAIVKFKTGIDISNASRAVVKEFDKLKKVQKKFTIDDNTELQRFLEKHKDAKIDRITEIIQNTLAVIQENKKKKVVLIIDDLDRVDPEHIFRLINVFSAYVDQDSNHNLFGFDHVIFVCDLENIKSIYHHRYGENTKFEGYIEKFYTQRPFYFNLSITSKLNIIHPNNLPENIGWTNKGIFMDFFRHLAESHIITIRSVIRLEKKDLGVGEKKYPLGVMGRKISNKSVLIIYFFDELEEIFISPSLNDILNNFRENGKNYDFCQDRLYWRSLITNCLIMLDCQSHLFRTDSEFTYQYNEFVFTYRISFNNVLYRFGILKMEDNNEQEPLDIASIIMKFSLKYGKEVLSDAYNVYKIYKNLDQELG